MSAQNVIGQIHTSLNFGEQISSGVLNPQNPFVNDDVYTSYPNGPGAGQVDQVHGKPYVIAPAGSTTLDLTNLTDLAGLPSSFGRGRELWAWIITGGPATIAPGTTNGWTACPTATLYPGGAPSRLIADPLSTGTGHGAEVTPTSKTITITSTNGATVALAIVGNFAA